MSNNWITVARFSHPVEAHLARTRLECEGIVCVVADEYLVRVDWLLSNAVGGVKLMVPAWELARAREALRPRPYLVDVADLNACRDENDEELICPRCRSYDVYFHRFDRRVASLFWLFAGFIVPWRSHKWVCKECGYEWKERCRSGSPLDGRRPL